MEKRASDDHQMNILETERLRLRRLGELDIPALIDLCRRCLAEVSHVGLNVKSDNLPARRLYEALGFADHASYDEYDAKTT